MNIDDLDYDYSEFNHYRWGWGESDEWFNPPVPGQRFKVSFGRLGRPAQSFREECIRAAARIAAQARGRIFVGLSGGSDSQTVCLALRESKIDFTPCILLLKQGINLHDIQGAFRFCYRFGLSPRIFTLDLDRFYAEDAVHYARQYRFSNPRTMIQLWLQRQVGAENTFIMGGGDPQFTRRHEPDGTLGPLSWQFKPTPILQYLIQNRLAGTTKFFMYSPELIASIVTHRYVRAFACAEDAIFDQAFMKPRNYWRIYNFTIKPMIYKENWPELISRPKYTGFELAEEKQPTQALAAAAVADAQRFNADKHIRIPVAELIGYFSAPDTRPARIWLSNPLPASHADMLSVAVDSPSLAQ